MMLPGAPFAETVLTVLWGTLRNNVTLNLQQRFFFLVKQYFIISRVTLIKKHFDTPLSCSCPLSYTPLIVLRAKRESSLQMRRKNAKHIHTEIHLHMHNIALLQKQNKRGAITHTHTHTQICFICIYMKSEFIFPYSLLCFCLYVACFFFISLSRVFSGAQYSVTLSTVRRE